MDGTIIHSKGWWHLKNDQIMVIKGVPKNPGDKSWHNNYIDQMLLRTPNKRVAVDIGANYGFLTGVMSLHYKKVIAFEPQKKVCECLVKNMKSFPNVEIHEQALSSKETKAIIDHVHNNSSGSTTIKFDNKGVLVTRTLDSYNLENVDLVKIDVDGHEVHVLKGAKETLLRCHPLVCIEVCSNKDLIREILVDYGYTFAKKYHKKDEIYIWKK